MSEVSDIRTIPCLRCGNDVTRARRGRAKRFCDSCQAERRVEQSRERMRSTRELEREMRDNLDHWVEVYGMERDYAESMYPRISDYAESLDAYDRSLPIVPDRMPDGANSPAGPDDGTSTYFGDLADELDAHARMVAQHPWFAANPHWAYGLHDPDEAAEYLNAA